MMFQYMIDDNNLPFKDYLDDNEQDIEFIKELLTGIKGPQAVCCIIFIIPCDCLLSNSETTYRQNIPL